MKQAIILGLLAAAAAAGVGARVRGASDETAGRYAAAATTTGVFECFDGSRRIAAAAVNDDFCDCADGSDEPGTSACPNSLFYCRNDGHVAASIASSKVNDGVCDTDLCCDGSDEYASGAVCPNVCAEVAEQAKIVKKEAKKDSDEGFRKKKEFLAKNAGKTESRIAELEAEIAKLDKEIATWEETVKILNEAEDDVRQKEKTAGGAEPASDGTDNADESQASPELQQAIAAADDAEESLETLKASRADSEDLLARLRSLAGLDLGPDGAFASLAESCLVHDSPEYVYTLCFFTKATQRSKATNAETALGTWGGFVGRDLTKHSGKDLRYYEALFENGDSCWTGVRRSLKLNLECGAENKIMYVSEPGKCEYEARILTIALCESDEKTDSVGVEHDEL